VSVKTIFSESLARKTDTSEEKITVAVEAVPNNGGFNVRYGGIKTDWQANMPNSSPIGGPIEGSPFSTVEMAVGVAKEIAQMQVNLGFHLVEVDGEPPSSQDGFQTHVRKMPPRH
jgi:hypothetical protein